MITGGPLLLPVPDEPTVCLEIRVRTGSSEDPEGREGLACLVARMIVEGGTARRSWPELLDAWYPLGALPEARVDREWTAFRVRVPREHAETAADLLCEMLVEPGFRTDDLERVRLAALADIRHRLRFGDDEELAKAALWSLVYAGSGYAHPVGGTVAGLEAIGRADLLAFRERWYRFRALSWGLAGAVPPGLVSHLERRLADLPGGPAIALSPAPAPALRPGAAALLVAKPEADASISVGRPLGLRRGERAFYGAAIATSWLGEHRSSVGRLFHVLREQRGLNYGDYAYLEAFPDAGLRQFPPPGVVRRGQLFEVWIRTLPDEAAPFALRVALAEIDRLVAEGVPGGDLPLFRSFNARYRFHHEAATADRLGHALDDLACGLRSEGHLPRLRRLATELTDDEIAAGAAAAMTPDRLGIAMVTGAPERIALALERGEAEPPAYRTPKPAAVHEADRRYLARELVVPRGNIAVVPVEEIFER
ncbi:MAG: hypothetical protein Kow0062_21770 [Acidobacteriota bacterium]